MTVTEYKLYKAWSLLVNNLSAEYLGQASAVCYMCDIMKYALMSEQMLITQVVF